MCVLIFWCRLRKKNGRDEDGETDMRMCRGRGKEK